jgi:predicted PurR-regulated permease PerM
MNEMPITVRRSLEALGLLAVCLLIIYGRDVVMPLMMAFFISLLILPIFRWLNNHRIPEILAIVGSIIVFLLIVAGIGFFLSYQIAQLLKDLDTIQTNLMLHWNKVSDWLNAKLHFSADQQLSMVKKQLGGLGGSIASYLQGAAVTLTGILVFVGLIPIYIFLMIFYRNLLLRFVFYWFKKEQYPVVEQAVRETEVIVKYYLMGLLIQIAYLTVLISGILMILGIKHAVLIGVTFAILNLIPYIGALIGNIIGVVLTLTSSQDLVQIWEVLGTIAIVQFVDNNILMPRIVGSKVKVNALASIVGIVVGGSLAGVSGMFLSIPTMAVLKIVFEKSEGLKQWGVLLGDDRPTRNVMRTRGIFPFKRKFEEKRDEEVEKAEDKAVGGDRS